MGSITEILGHTCGQIVAGFNEQDVKQHMIMQNIAHSTWHVAWDSMDKAFYRSMRNPKTILWNSQMPRTLDHRAVLINSVVPLPVSILFMCRYTCIAVDQPCICYRNGVELVQHSTLFHSD